MSENPLIQQVATSAEQTRSDLESMQAKGYGLLVIELYHPDGKHHFNVRAMVEKEVAKGDNFFEQMVPAFEMIAHQLKALDEKKAAA